MAAFLPALTAARALAFAATVAAGGAAGAAAQETSPAHDATVRFEVRELAGVAGARVPVTLSALLAPGRFRDGSLCAVVRDGAGGRPEVVAPQVDVLSRHADGSLLHALVTLPVDVEARGVEEIWLVPSPAAPPTGPFPDSPALPAVAVELIERGGARFAAVVEPGDGAPLPGRGLAGPLARELEARARLRSGAGERRDLALLVRWRQLAGVAGARVEVVVENGEPPGAGLAPLDVAFERVVVVAGDELLADLRDGVLWDRTRFAVRRHVGGAAPRLRARQELADLVRNGWLPPYDAGCKLAPARAEELARRAIDSEGNGSLDPEWPELGRPLDPGPIHRHMPGTGDRDDIGPIPAWAAVALQSTSATADALLAAADGNGSGAFPIHVRAADGEMGLRFGDAAPLARRSTGRKCPQTPDRAHAPLLGYVSFILTGERLAEEEFAAWAAHCFYDWPHDGRYRYPGSRDFAWSLRTTMLAAHLLPDAHPRKEYFRDRVAANLADLAAMIAQSPSPLHAWGSGSFASSGRKTWPCATQWSPWQASWVAASCWWTWRLHGDANARALWDWQARYFTRAYAEVGTTWRAPDGTSVRWSDGHHALAYSFPVATYVPRLAGGEWRQVPDSRAWIGSFAEALWWLRVNLDHEFDPGRPPDLPAARDGSRSLPPEQWRPRGAYSPPPPPAASWVVYAMHWFTAVARADGLEGSAAIDAAVRPLIDREIADPALRMVPGVVHPR